MSKRPSSHTHNDNKSRKKKKLSSSTHKWIAERSHAHAHPLRGCRLLHISCNRDRENKAFDEMMLWLTSYHDRHFSSSSSVASSSSSSSSSSASASLEAELAELREESLEKRRQGKSVNDSKAFQRIRGGGSEGQSVLFIKLTDDRILDICNMIRVMLWEVAHETKQQQQQQLASSSSSVHPSQQTHIRYTSRVIPLEMTCSAQLDSFVKMATVLLPQKCSPEALTGYVHAHNITTTTTTPTRAVQTYSVVVQRRSKDVLRQDIIDAVVSILSHTNKQLSVDLKHPDIVVMCVFDYQFAGISVLFEYEQLKQYNVRQLTQTGAAIAVPDVVVSSSAENV